MPFFVLTHILPCTLDACMCKKPCPKLETEYILVLFGYNKRQVNCFHYRTSYWHLLFMLFASQPHFVNRSINMTSKSSRHFEPVSLCFKCNIAVAVCVILYVDVLRETCKQWFFCLCKVPCNFWSISKADVMHSPCVHGRERGYECVRLNAHSKREWEREVSVRIRVIQYKTKT